MMMIMTAMLMARINHLGDDGGDGDKNIIEHSSVSMKVDR